MKELTIGDLTAKLPIIQGGMGIGISLSKLASAVANEGGIGVISSAAIGMHENDFQKNYNEANNRALLNEIRKARTLTNGIIGINVMVAMTNFEEVAKTAISENVDLLIAGAGLPLKLPAFLKKDSVTKLIPIVSSSRATRVLCKKWFDHYNYLPDAIIVEGPMAGGHLGFKKEHIFNPDYSLENILPGIIETVSFFENLGNKKIPVIAAGGIFTGSDIYKYLKMGASGVQMATRFVTTFECDASNVFKQAYLDCKKEDIHIITSPVGMPGRVIKSKFLERTVLNGVRPDFDCSYLCIGTCDMNKSPYCIADALLNAKKGNLDNGFAFCGANAYRCNEIISVKQLIGTLVSEYNECGE